MATHQLTRIEDADEISALVELIDGASKKSSVDTELYKRVDRGYLGLFLYDKLGEELLEFVVKRELKAGKLADGGAPGRPSAAFVTDGSKTWLAHNGTVHRTKARFSKPTTEVSTSGKAKKYHIVSDVEADDVLLNITTFSASRHDKTIDISTEIETDDGPSSTKYTKDCETDDKHRRAVQRLRAQLVGLGFSGWKHRSPIRCDCAASLGKENYIFEVKTTPNLTHVCAAVGQLSIYSKFTGKKPILVLCSPAGMTDPLKQYVHEMDIIYWPYDLVDGVEIFDVLPGQ